MEMSGLKDPENPISQVILVSESNFESDSSNGFLVLMPLSQPMAGLGTLTVYVKVKEAAPDAETLVASVTLLPIIAF